MVHHCSDLNTHEMVTNYTDEETFNFLKNVSIKSVLLLLKFIENMYLMNIESHYE